MTTPGYHNWYGMRARCRNPKNPAYRFYGARGINYCDRWESFANFIADMGPPPAGLTLDRIDTLGNYEPSNCRWANSHTQHNNTRSNRRITIGEETRTLAEWAAHFGVHRQTLSARLSRGVDMVRATNPEPLPVGGDMRKKYPRKDRGA